MVVTTPSSISFYLNTPVVLTDSNSEYYGTSPYYSTSVNLMVRWEDLTKEIVGLNETYEPINAVVSSEAFIDFDLTYKKRFFIKEGKPYWIKQMKIVPNLDGGIDYYQYFVVRIAHLP